MKIENVILGYLEKHPGASAKKIYNSVNFKMVGKLQLHEEKLKSVIFKKLRILRREGKLHNNRNAWYILNKKSS